MNIKSLLLGSAAALAAVSGAQAADAIVAAEPEPMEYVRVCDAFGTGYFYIPGTETCLKIGGWVRFQVDFGRDLGSVEGSTSDFVVQKLNSSDWDAFGRANLTVIAKSDTELGTLTSLFASEWSADQTDSTQAVIDEAYLQLGGFKAGYFNGFWDKGLNGETDTNANKAKFVSVAYIYQTDAFSAGVTVDELENINAGPKADNSNGIGVTGIVSGTVGAVSADLLGGYDTESEEGAIRGLLSAEAGPGVFQIFGLWGSGKSAYWNASEWSVAASYQINATESFFITPAVQYFSDTNFDDAGSPDTWKYGVTAGYKITEGLNALATVNYVDADAKDGQTTGFFRLERSF